MLWPGSGRVVGVPPQILDDGLGRGPERRAPGVHTPRLSRAANGSPAQVPARRPWTPAGSSKSWVICVAGRRCDARGDPGQLAGRRAASHRGPRSVLPRPGNRMGSGSRSCCRRSRSCISRARPIAPTSSWSRRGPGSSKRPAGGAGPLHGHLLPGRDRAAARRDRELRHVPGRKLVHPADRPAAVHTNPAGSRLAIRHFTEYLEQFPDDLEVRWLLNLAHMTLGEHPDKVDPRFLIRLDRLPQVRVRHRQVPRHRPPGRGQPLQHGRRRDHGRLRQRRPARSRRHVLRSRPSPWPSTATRETAPSRTAPSRPA